MRLAPTVYKLTGKIICSSIELSLTLTLLGGQSFRWKHIGPGDGTLSNRFQGVFRDRLWILWQDLSHLHYTVHSKDKLDEAKVEGILRAYFRLDENLEEHYREWSCRDGFFKQTCGEFVGIRMLNQDLRENIFSFLCSSNNNIARISGMIDKMSTEYGDLICTLDEDCQKPSDSVSPAEEKVKSDTFKVKEEPINCEDTEHIKLKGSINEAKPGKKRQKNGTVADQKGAKKARAGECCDARSEIELNVKRSTTIPTVIKEPDENGLSKSTRNEISLANDQRSDDLSLKSQKSRKKDSKSIKSMTQANGNAKVHKTKGLRFFSFPSIESLAKPAVESRLRELGFGYRAKFIQQSAEYIVKSGGDEWLRRLEQMSYEEARTELMRLQGIGAKVADCICLISLSHLQSVPVDTHVYQIAVNHYAFAKSTSKTLTPSVYNKIRGFFIEKFGPYAGWAHSILFCADLKKFQTKSPEKARKQNNRKANI